MRQRHVESAPSEAPLLRGSDPLTAGEDRLVETIPAELSSVRGTETTVAGEAIAKVRHDRLRRANLLAQPAMHWSALMLVAAVTGALSIDNPSVRQPILLHAVPQVLALLAGYRLRDPKLGALSGASFHVARALLIVLLGAWPRFAEVCAAHPVQMAWLFVLPPALGMFGGWLGSVRETVASRRGAAPLRTSLAAGLAVIALSTAGIAPRFLESGVRAPGSAPLQTIPGNPGFLPYFSENTGTMGIGDAQYDFGFNVAQVTDALDAVARTSAPGTVAPMLTREEVLRSAVGDTTVSLDSKGNLTWTRDGKATQIAAGKQPFSQLSLSNDGNMVAFRQGDRHMVFTPSKGTRPVEDLIRQFWNDAPFQVEDGQALAASFNRARDTLDMVFRAGDGTAYTAALRMLAKDSPPAPPGTVPSEGTP